MSYKNTSIPLRPGLNLIIGPNGAGKSSILLGISVVLGQAFTERAKKLSELIRWNERDAGFLLVPAYELAEFFRSLSVCLTQYDGDSEQDRGFSCAVWSYDQV